MEVTGEEEDEEEVCVCGGRQWTLFGMLPWRQGNKRQEVIGDIGNMTQEATDVRMTAEAEGARER